MLVMDDGMVTAVSLSQYKNVSPSMLVTEEGMVTAVSSQQFLNAPLPMLVTEDGMLTDVRLLQSSYIDITDYQLFIVNTIEKWNVFSLDA